jgi:hypothetical protein
MAEALIHDATDEALAARPPRWLAEERREAAALLAGFEATNAALVVPSEALLARVTGDTALHVRFMNTLSMLEHLGSHKIMATQHGAAIDQATLKHLAEETRHALFFKRHAERLAGRTLAYDRADLLAGASALGYFHRLEAAIVRALPAAADSRTAYLITSMIVEFRAVWAYRLYQSVLSRSLPRMSLKSLLAEESGHLADMVERLAALGAYDQTRIAALWSVETGLYTRLLDALTAATRA